MIIFSCSCQIRKHIFSLQRNRTLTLNPWNCVFQPIHHTFAFTKYLTDLLTRAKNFLHNSALSEVALASKPSETCPPHGSWNNDGQGTTPAAHFFFRPAATKTRTERSSLNTDNQSLHSTVQAHVKANSLPLKKRKKSLVYTGVTENRIWPFDNWLFYTILISLAGILKI